MFPWVICFYFLRQVLGAYPCPDHSWDDVITGLKENNRILCAWRNAAMLFELFHCLLTISFIVNFFHPFIFFASDEPFIKRDGTKSYYLWGEFLLLVYSLLTRVVFVFAVWTCSRFPRVVSLFEYLA